MPGHNGCYCDTCQARRARYKRWADRRKAKKLAQLADPMFVRHDTIQWECKWCHWEGGHWVVFEGKVRMHLRCWDCQRGFYIQTFRQPGGRRRFHFDAEEFAARYRAGERVADLAAELGCTTHVIHRRLRAVGVVFPTRSQNLKMHSPETLAAMRALARGNWQRKLKTRARRVKRFRSLGYTNAQIAERMGLSKGQVKYAYRETYGRPRARRHGSARAA